MKILKIKLWLFSLLAILAVSVFMASCEQDTLDLSIEEGLESTTNDLRSSGDVHSCFGLNLVELINSYQTPNLVKSPTQTFTSLSALQSKINSKTNHNGAVYALAAGTYNGTLRIVNKRNLCVYTNPNNPATINASGKNFGINVYNNQQGVNSNIEILNFRITGAKFHGIYLGGDDADPADDDPRFAPRGTWVAGTEVFDVARTVGGGIVVRNAFEGATIKIESNEVYDISLTNLGSSGEGIYIGEGNDHNDYSSNVHIIGNYLHDLTGEAIDIKRKSADILIEYNKIDEINVKSQAAIVLGLDPLKTNDAYDGEFVVRRNSISNVTNRGHDGNFIVVANGSTLIEENVMWNAVKHGIDVYNDCDGPNKSVIIRNNIIWDYIGLPIRNNIGNGNRGPNDPCTINRTNNIVESDALSSECEEDASIFVGPLTTLEGFAPPTTTANNSIDWNPTPTSISNGNNKLTLDYSINQNGVVFIQVFDKNWNKIDQDYKSVSIGTDRITLNLDVPNGAASASNNHLQVFLLSSDWSNQLVRDDLNLPSGNTPPPPTGNSLAWNPTPTNISNGNNPVTLDYSIDENGILLVQVFDSSWGLVGQVFENVSSGARQSTLTLPANGLSASNNHLEAKLLNSSWGDIGVQKLYVSLP